MVLSNTPKLIDRKLPRSPKNAVVFSSTANKNAAIGTNVVTATTFVGLISPLGARITNYVVAIFIFLAFHNHIDIIPEIHELGNTAGSMFALFSRAFIGNLHNLSTMQLTYILDQFLQVNSIIPHIQHNLHILQGQNITQANQELIADLLMHINSLELHLNHFSNQVASLLQP